MNHSLIPSLYPHIFTGLTDAMDDVISVAASALLPVVHECVFNDAIDTDALLTALWDALRDLDDLSSATNAFMTLLSEILRVQAETDPDLVRASASPLPQVVPRLFPFMSHSSTSVRRATLNTLKTLTSNIQLAQMFLPHVVTELCCFLFQRVVLEFQVRKMSFMKNFMI